MKSDNDVVITGVGIVICHGVGIDAHIALLCASAAPEAIVETEKFAPYPIHPLPEIDWSSQIGRKDQRQMENWQRLGVFAAGLALDDAGLKDDAEACGTMDMIVAAGGGERDINVDTLEFASSPTFTQVDYHGEAALLATYDGGASSVLLIGLTSADEPYLHVDVSPPNVIF